MELKFLHKEAAQYFIQDRPAFVQFIDRDNTIPLNDDYILQIDDKNLFVSIIKLKKGGKKNMTTKIVRVAKPKMEEYLKEFEARKESLEERKSLAIEEAVKKVTEEIELEFAQETETLDRLIGDVSEEKEIEVEDEPVEETEAKEVVEGETPVEETPAEAVPTEQPVNQVF